MPYSQESGYTPASIPTIMNDLMLNINTQFGTAYTSETFVGTNFYKYFYALAQRLQENEVKTSEIFLKLTQYITVMNERISRPVNTSPGIVEKLESEGYIASVKPITDTDAGKIFIAIDADDGINARGKFTITSYANLITGTADSVTVGATVFTAQAGAATPGAGTFQASASNAATALSLVAQINAHATAGALVKAVAYGSEVHVFAKDGGTAGNAIATVYTNNDANVGATVLGATLSGGTTNADYATNKAELALLISQITVGGTVTQGSQVTAIVLSNGQSFDYKFNLPDKLETYLKLTITLSENNQFVVGTPDDIKALLLSNIAARYRLGRNFEPQKYFSVSDAPWASQVLLEWSHDGGNTYSSSVYDSAYDKLFDVKLENITLVEV